MVKKRLNKKTIVSTGLILLVLLFAAGAGYYYMQARGNATRQQLASGSDNINSDSLSFSREIAEVAQSQGSEAAQKKIDEKIRQAETAEEKAHLYALKVATASSSADANAAETALQYAYKADELYPTFGSALNIADLEYAAKNNTAALKYYELYMKKSTGSDGASLDPTGKVFYERRIQELKA